MIWHPCLALGRKADTRNHVCITLGLFPLPHWLSALELPFQNGFQNHLYQGKLYILKHDSVSHLEINVWGYLLCFGIAALYNIG